MKKVSGLALAASLALGVLTVAGPAAAETVTTVYNDVQDEIIDVDLENGFGFTYNVDTGDTQYWKQDDDGEWFEIKVGRFYLVAPTTRTPALQIQASSTRLSVLPWS